MKLLGDKVGGVLEEEDLYLVSFQCYYLEQF